MYRFISGSGLLVLGLLLTAAIGLWDVSKGGTGIRAAALDTAIMGGGGSAPFVPTAVPDCPNALAYNGTTHAFFCNTGLSTLPPTTTTTTTSTTTTI